MEPEASVQVTCAVCIRTVRVLGCAEDATDDDAVDHVNDDATDDADDVDDGNEVDLEDDDVVEDDDNADAADNGDADVEDVINEHDDEDDVGGVDERRGFIFR